MPVNGNDEAALPSLELLIFGILNRSSKVASADAMFALK